MATRTVAQRRSDERADYDAYLAACPSRQVMARLSDKWVTLAICALADGPLRYFELARIIAGVSPKMLTQTLRNLERDGLLTRTVEATVPATVTYELTELGTSLVQAFAALKHWSEAHWGGVLEARHHFDANRQVPGTA